MYTCTLIWKDKNAPKMQEHAATLETAKATVNHWAKTFAGVKALKIHDDPEKVVHIFTPSPQGATYQFSIPYIGK